MEEGEVVAGCGGVEEGDVVVTGCCGVGEQVRGSEG